MTFPMPSDAQAQGTIETNLEDLTDAVGAPDASDLTITCPATTNVIWIITVTYAY